MNGHSPNLARSAQILRFLLRYRSAGVFTGIDLDSASLPMTSAMARRRSGATSEPAWRTLLPITWRSAACTTWVPECAWHAFNRQS